MAYDFNTGLHANNFVTTTTDLKRIAYYEAHIKFVEILYEFCSVGKSERSDSWYIQSSLQGYKRRRGMHVIWLLLTCTFWLMILELDKTTEPLWDSIGGIGDLIK